MRRTKRYIAVRNCQDPVAATRSARAMLRMLGGTVGEASVTISLAKTLESEHLCIFRVIAPSAWLLEMTLLSFVVARIGDRYLAPSLMSGTISALEEKLFNQDPREGARGMKAPSQSDL